MGTHPGMCLKNGEVAMGPDPMDEKIFSENCMAIGNGEC